MPKKKSSLRKWIILVVFLLIGGTVAFLGTRNRTKGAEVSVRSIERGDITSLVSATGRIHPETQVVISSEVPGEIVELPVVDGQFVERGELLVRVNPDTLEAQVKQQEASLASIKANSASQRASLLQAQLDLKRIQDLAGRGFVPQSDLDQALTRVDAAQASFESSQHQIERQEMQLKEARDQLAKASLYAPLDGTVVSINAELGDRVVGTGQFAGTNIMSIANLENMEVRIQVSEVDIVNVGIGNVATIEVDALPGENFPGRVSEIANSALTSAERSQEQQTTFEVRIKLDKAGERLRPGMTATADIQTKTVTDVIKAPLGSVVVRPRREVREALSGNKSEEASEAAEVENRDSDGGENGRRGQGGSGRFRDDRARVVFVHVDGKALMHEVETGISDRGFIEIKSGLTGDEQIVSGPYRAITRDLTHESPVTIRTEEERGPRNY